MESVRGGTVVVASGKARRVRIDAQPAAGLQRTHAAQRSWTAACRTALCLAGRQHFQSAFKDRTAYDDFEISGLRWVHSIKGWGWLACVHFQDHGHRRTYALLIQDNVVADGRYAVETDTCEAQSFTQFDVATGVLGRPTTPAQPALY